AVSAPASGRVSAWRFAGLKGRFGERYGEHATRLASVLTLVGLWYFGAAVLPPNIMPAPHIVSEVLWQEILKGAIWTDVLITMTRIILSFAIAIGIATVVGVAMGVSRAAERFFDVWVI